MAPPSPLGETTGPRPNAAISPLQLPATSAPSSLVRASERARTIELPWLCRVNANVDQSS